MNLTPRQQQILQLIVKLYGETEEPIGSRTLLNKSLLNVSPATIRNDMMVLEQLGYLMKAHSSSGRIPSFDGYRYYIDQLITHPNEPKESFLEGHYDLEQYSVNAADKLSKLSGFPVAVLIQNEKYRRMRDFRINRVDQYQLMASIITDHGHVESQLFELPYALDDEAIEKVEKIIRDELKDLTLDDVYQRMKLTIPLKIQQAISIQLNFAALVKKAIDAHERYYYSVLGKNHLFDLMDPQVPTQAWKTLFALLDGNETWFSFLTKSKNGIDVTFEFESPPYRFKNLSIVTAKQKIGNYIVTFGLVGPSAMPYQRVIHHMNEILLELSNY